MYIVKYSKYIFSVFYLLHCGWKKCRILTFGLGLLTFGYTIGEKSGSNQINWVFEYILLNLWSWYKKLVGIMQSWEIFIFLDQECHLFVPTLEKNIAYGDFDSTGIDVVLLYKNLVNFVPTFVHTS